MKQRFTTLLVILSLISGISNASVPLGRWRGDLRVGPSSLPLVLNLDKDGEAVSCTMDSPAQNAYGIPASVDYASPDSIAVSISSIGASFRGHVAIDEIKGLFTQMGRSFPLTLKCDEPLSVRRPQTPRSPFPYQIVDTVFRAADGTLLSCTVSLPEAYDREKTPICVMVSGSGPQNRDEEIFDHKPFAVIADYLASSGVASLRYDDRGTAQSAGDYATSTIATFREDAKSALRFARTFTDSKAGILGHSEGGTIALLLAEEGEPDFVVSLAGMAISGKETVLKQNERVLLSSGLDPESIANSMTLLNEVFDRIVSRSVNGTSATLDVDAIVSELGLEVPQGVVQSIKNSLKGDSGYFGSLLATDAGRGMDKINCPVLALNGTLDTQVSCRENLSAIEAGIRKAQVREMPGLNHLFQHAKTGEVSEYSEIKETISPEVLGMILTFLQKDI